MTEYPALVFLPCPGRPACPEQLFGVEFHQHFMRGHRVRVRRLLPGCWEALCPCCPERPVVAQVATWERAMLRASEHVREVHRVLRSSDPQPPPGTRVRDDCGQVWVNDGCYPCAWSPEGGGEPESWRKVAGNYGPVTVLEWADGD